MGSRVHALCQISHPHVIPLLSSWHALGRRSVHSTPTWSKRLAGWRKDGNHVGPYAEDLKAKQAAPARQGSLEPSKRSATRPAGWRANGQHLPPYSDWLAEKSKEDPSVRRRPIPKPSSRSPREAERYYLRHPVPLPTLHAFEPTTYAHLSSLEITYHLPRFPTPSLALDELERGVLDPLLEHLKRVGGSLAKGASDVLHPVSVLWTFRRSSGDDVRATFALVHASDLKMQDALRAMLERLLKQEGEVFVFIVHLASAGEGEGRSEEWRRMLGEEIVREHLASRGRLFVNPIDTTSTSFPPALQILAFMASLAEEPHVHQVNRRSAIAAALQREKELAKEGELEGLMRDGMQLSPVGDSHGNEELQDR